MVNKVGIYKEEIKKVINKLNNISPYSESSELEKMAIWCDEGSQEQDLISSCTLYLYAYFNGSKFAEKRLRQMGYCPDYFRNIVFLSENPGIDSDNIVNLISIETSNKSHSHNSLRGIITSSFLFVDAIASLGLIIFNNYQMGLEYELSILLSLTAADSSVGQGLASLIVGNHYFGVKEYKKSFEYFQKSVQKGNPDAMYSLSAFYFNGIGGIEKDPLKAIELLYKAANLGNQRAKNVIDRLFS